MPANVITSIGGNAVNGSTSYRVVFPAGDPLVRRKSVQYARRRIGGPRVIARNWEPLEFSLLIAAADTATAYATLKTTVEQWFQPWGRSTTRLVATWHDGTSVYVDVELLELRPRQDAGAVQTVQYEARCAAPTPIWRAESLTTSASNPASVTNSGNVPTAPTIELTTSTHVTYRSCQVSGAGQANGFVATPIRFALNDATATATNVFVWVNGVPTKCKVVNGGTTTSAVWALVDTNPDGTSTQVDIIYGSGLTNPLCGQLDDPDLFDTASVSNTSWRWDNWPISTHPSFAGSWVPAATGYQNPAANIVYQLRSDGASVTFELRTQGTSDYDSMYVAIPGAVNNSGSSNIVNLSRVTANFNGVSAQAYVRGRPPNSDRWTTLWSTRANATVTTSISVSGNVYIAIAAGIENDAGGADDATLTLDDTGTPVQIGINTPPTVTVGAAQNYDYYSGDYTIGNYTINFPGTFAPDATLTLDCETGIPTTSGSGPIYNAPLPTTADGWPLLVPGANAVTDGLGATDVIKHRNAFG